jgi:hypothetical protein
LSLLCPKCHRPFTKEVLESEPVKVWEHQPEHLEEEDFPLVRAWPSSVDVPKEVVEVEHRCTCRHCKYEWTEATSVVFGR